MVTKNTVVIEDFSELGQSFNFKCNNKIYSIPPIPPFVAKKLIKTVRESTKKSSANEELIKKLQEEQSEIPEELLEEAESFFDFQINFILVSRVIEINDKGEKINDVTKEDIEGDEEKEINGWSTQVVLKVFRKINEIISVEPEKKS